jgi:hypothetical protein
VRGLLDNRKPALRQRAMPPVLGLVASELTGEEEKDSVKCGPAYCRCTPHNDRQHCICYRSAAQSFCCYCQQRCEIEDDE